MQLIEVLIMHDLAFTVNEAERLIRNNQISVCGKVVNNVSHNIPEMYNVIVSKGTHPDNVVKIPHVKS